MIISSDELYYATPRLDRMAHKRSALNDLTSRIENKNALFYIIHDNRHLFEESPEGLLPVVLDWSRIKEVMGQSPIAYLGDDGQQDLFVVDTSSVEEEVVLKHLGYRFLFEDLRRAGPLSQKDHASHMAYGRGLMYWHSRHQYCGACGHPTLMKQAGHVRVCQNPACGLEHFPRTDPAVIMLVIDGDDCLLAHHGKMRDGMYSTLAGFVEPGETLEQAVRREVFEETGVRIGDVSYAGNQPWPFPASLMIGYYAQAKSREIKLDTNELKDAQWFSKNDLRHFREQGKRLPSADSIARNMIEAWLRA